MLLITVAVLVIIVHQAIVLLSHPVNVWHSLTHITLLVIAAALIFDARAIWSCYLRLRHDQSAVLDAYANTEELSEKTGESLRQSESLLESLFSTISDRILVIDQHNRIVKANKTAATWVGRDPTHHEFTEIYPTCDNQDERRNELNLIEFTRATQKIHRGRLLRDGADCSTLLSVDTYPVSLPEDNSNLVISIARDVTEQTGRELVSRHREKIASLGLLVAGIAHDLGNPLASLSSELELLHENDPEKIRESLNTVNEHVKRIKRKLHDIVQFAKRPDENRQDVDICEAIDQALKLTRYDQRARRIQFNIDTDDVSLVRIKNDDLVLILVNLIVNAFDAMPEGGKLSINASMTPTGDALLTVADTGVGMDAATLQQATQPLFTTKNINNGKSGTGLGLSMVNQLINSVGGELILASEPGCGSRITLRLPVVATDHPETNRKP